MSDDPNPKPEESLEDEALDGPQASEPEDEGGSPAGPESGSEERPDVEAEADAEDEAEAEAEAEPLRDPDTTSLNRIARSFREDGAVGAGAELTSSVLGSVRELGLPLATLVILATMLIAFRQILLPFILACALVYLMEPIIRLLTRQPGRPRGLPRWVGVVLVYLSFIFVISASVVFVVPTFVAEIVRFAEEVPQLVQDFRQERLPGINRNLQDFLRNYLPVPREDVEEDGLHMEVAQAAIMGARKTGAARATAVGNLQRTLRAASSTEVQWQAEAAPDGPGGSYVLVPAEPARQPFTLSDALSSSGWVYGDARRGLLVEPLTGGALRVSLNEVAVEVKEVDEGSWIIRQKDVDAVPIKRASSSVEIDKMFDLEARLDDLIQNLVSTSNERLGSVIDFAQKLVVGVVGTFVAVLLTLMVAGFISIDLPRVMAFMRSLVPRHMRSGYDVLLEQLDSGLAGVVRGQLLICVVNGTLTYFGLLLIGIKFRVLLAVIAGILSLIPVFGTVLSTIPIVLIGLTQGPYEGLMAFLWILGIHALEANLLNPKIIGTSAHIHPVIVIFALLAGESAYGLVGALLAVPTASILLTLFNFVRTRAWTQAEGLEPSP